MESPSLSTSHGLFCNTDGAVVRVSEVFTVGGEMVIIWSQWLSCMHRRPTKKLVGGLKRGKSGSLSQHSPRRKTCASQSVGISLPCDIQGSPFFSIPFSATWGIILIRLFRARWPAGHLGLSLVGEQTLRFPWEERTELYLF